MTRAMKQPRKDVLRDQLVAAADEIIRLRERLAWWERNGVAGLWQVSVPGVNRLTMRARLRRWWARVWS